MEIKEANGRKKEAKNEFIFSFFSRFSYSVLLVLRKTN